MSWHLFSGHRPSDSKKFSHTSTVAEQCIAVRGNKRAGTLNLCYGC